MKKLIVILAAFGLALSAEAQETCSPTADINQDGIVGTGDLLALLSDYGIADADFDGINDLFDDCIEDECGVCDGPGATLILIDAITVLYDSVYLPLQDEWFVYEIGADTTFVVQCEIFGCLDATACNFSDEANVDNGNCDYISCYGCNIPSACNFDASATMFDDSCDFESCAGCLDSLACNYDPDNTIAIDLLCDFESCTGCTDQDAMNFDPAATIDNDSCTYGPLECGGASTVTFDGYTYELVVIGDQCWFAENLRTEHYVNGDAIPAMLTDDQWSSYMSGALTVYGEDAGCQDFSPDGYACDPDWSLNEYGRLYNWYAVDDARGLCPTGWHVPMDQEWMTLEIELGMAADEADNTGYRGTDQGTQMKTAYGWHDAGWGTNSSGFSGLPGGQRSSSGYFGNAGISCYWWSSSQSVGNSWSRVLNKNYSTVSRYEENRHTGFSVRCLKDSE